MNGFSEVVSVVEQANAGEEAVDVAVDVVVEQAMTACCSCGRSGCRGSVIPSSKQNGGGISLLLLWSQCFQIKPPEQVRLTKLSDPVDRRWM